MGSNKKLSWTEADVQCPFFISENKRTVSVTCEGHDQDTNISVRFKDARARDRFMGRHCCALYGFHNCPYYRFLLHAKYNVD